ncbi:hypothetical protein [Pseudomonas sp. Teo4]|uniref:hypothetical protein n=1 Tax=Pseudomonas sp. Teo4 TaxID=3064528 RepID=UPI002ACB062E|nr:hypothetical protein [Pseudomonas sp. Teo4]
MVELKGYEVYFSSDDVPPEVKFPEQWVGFGLSSGCERFVPAEWSDFSDLLPWVSAWLDKCVVGTVLAVADKPYLIYVYSEDGSLYFYMGGAPLNFEAISLDEYSYLSVELKKFYMEVHNGFGFYIGCTMGPSRLEDFVVIKDLCDEDYPSLPNMVGVFSNGGGDYLSLSSESLGREAFIWWHENPEEPTCGVDLWDVMDSWMSIFLENSDSNKSF